MNPVIDTLRFSDKLQEGGFTSEQANVLARALGDELMEQLATKADIKTLKDDVSVLKEDVIVLKDDVAVLKKDVVVLKQDVAVLKKDVVVLKQDVAALKKDVIVLKEDVAVLKKDVIVLKQDVAVMKGEIKGLNAKFNYTMALIGLLVALELIPVAGMVLG